MPYLGTIKLISFNISIVLVFANLQNSLEKNFYSPLFLPLPQKFMIIHGKLTIIRGAIKKSELARLFDADRRHFLNLLIIRQH